MTTQTLDRELQMDAEREEAWPSSLDVDPGSEGDALQLRLLDALFPGEMARVTTMLAALDATHPNPPF